MAGYDIQNPHVSLRTRACSDTTMNGGDFSIFSLIQPKILAILRVFGSFTAFLESNFIK
jgi:hypothetical protein